MRFEANVATSWSINITDVCSISSPDFFLPVWSNNNNKKKQKKLQAINHFFSLWCRFSRVARSFCRHVPVDQAKRGVWYPAAHHEESFGERGENTDVLICLTNRVTEWICSAVCLLKVLLVPGGVFMIDSNEPCPYVRAAFSLSTPDQIDEVHSHTLTHICIYICIGIYVFACTHSLYSNLCSVQILNRVSEDCLLSSKKPCDQIIYILKKNNIFL